MAEVLDVDVRQSRGKHGARRLRAAGSVPAVLYGHGGQTISLSVPSEQLDTILRHGSRVVTLAGGVNERAFVRQLQWDAWGTHVLHVDFSRISEHETVEVQVSLELRGEAPGLKEGGVIEQLLHQCQVECEAGAIPEKLDVNINSLKLTESITIADLKPPTEVKILDAPDTVIVQCMEPVEEIEEETVAAAEVEPEVIGRKEEEAEGK